jgi:hypothetical protein
MSVVVVSAVRFRGKSYSRKITRKKGSTVEEQKFDGYTIDHFAGRFSGSFDLETHYQMDDEVSFIVVAKVKAAGIKSNRGGDLVRVNTFEVLEVSPTGAAATGRRVRNAATAMSEQLELQDDPSFSNLQLGPEMSDDEWGEDEDDEIIAALQREVENDRSEDIFSPDNKSELKNGGKASLYDDRGWS